MSKEVLKTPLHNLHQQFKAKMAPFAGYDMPIQYERGIKHEHLHTREKAGLFDVSHMGQIKLSGSNAAQALEQLVPADIIGLKPGQQRYALFTDNNGVILDDLMVSNIGSDSLLLVVNAACKQQDLAHVKTHLDGQCKIHSLEDHALLALQGPKSVQLLEQIFPEVSDLVFMTGCFINFYGAECYITRSGYTGEDGFEISVPNAFAEKLAETLLSFDEVELIGLGARDSLRLEAGLCLYGHDIDNTTTPVQGSLVWSIGKSRRLGGERVGGYPGSEIIENQIATGSSRKRVGLVPEGKAPIREGTEILDQNQLPVGHITSGGYSPTLAKPIAMGYVDKENASIGNQLFAMVRGKALPVIVTALPFVKTNYYRG